MLQFCDNFIGSIRSTYSFIPHTRNEIFPSYFERETDQIIQMHHSETSGMIPFFQGFHNDLDLKEHIHLRDSSKSIEKFRYFYKTFLLYFSFQDFFIWSLN
jgi:hypothetical protein